MKNRDITKRDYVRIVKLKEAFVKALKQKEDKVCDKFIKEMSFFQACRMEYYKLRHYFASVSKPHKKAAFRIAHDDMALPILKKTFGEDAIRESFPQKALNEETAKFFEGLGGRNIARFIRNEIS